MRTHQRETVSVFCPRMVLGFLLFVAVFIPSVLQPLLSRLYSFLYQSPFYRFSGFETMETVLCYIIIEPLYTYKFGRNPQMRIDMRGAGLQKKDNGKPKVPKMRRPLKRAGELVTYASPLLMMDFTMIKKFAGVPVSDIRQTGGYRSLSDEELESISPNFLLPTLHNFSWSSPLQLQRALPPSPLTSRGLVLELITALFIYDALFFFIHIAFHRIKFLARIHRPHHTHAEIHPQVTNRLSIAERLSLILLANFSLNIIGSHVLTRSAFIPVFVGLLIDVHSGLDLPWGYDKILPFGMGAGSRVHAIHHRTGEGAFQPFFCWWDAGLEWIEQKTGETSGNKSI
jgi:cholesterol 25-hydroxylase